MHTKNLKLNTGDLEQLFWNFLLLLLYLWFGLVSFQTSDIMKVIIITTSNVKTAANQWCMVYVLSALSMYDSTFKANGKIRNLLWLKRMLRVEKKFSLATATKSTDLQHTCAHTFAHTFTIYHFTIYFGKIFFPEQHPTNCSLVSFCKKLFIKYLITNAYTAHPFHSIDLRFSVKNRKIKAEEKKLFPR